MSFESHAGTRGGRQPKAGLLMRTVNKVNMRQLRRTGKAFGFSGLILTTTGAKSGAERTHPVAWWSDSGDGWLIVAAANGGARNPAWYYNVAAHPDRVRVEVDGKHIDVTASQLYGTARSQAWQQITKATPLFKKYQDKTDRELPIIHLVPR